MNNFSHRNEKHTVLIADDDSSVRCLLEITLTNAGFKVIETKNGLEALSAYHQHQPDIVLLDVEMPFKDGHQVCREIRKTEHGQQVPVVMITGTDDVHAVNQAFEMGATDFIAKPIHWPMIGHRVRYLMRANKSFAKVKSNETKMRYLALHDELTGLPNRQQFRHDLSNIIKLAKRYNFEGAVLFIDLDRFKRINDTLGHTYGDLLLKQIARRLEDKLRETDMVARNNHTDRLSKVARLGGDEFTVILSRLENPNAAAKVAERIIQALAQPFNLDGHEVVVTPSIGIATFPANGLSTDEVLMHADRAMYCSKENGGNGYQFYIESMSAKALERLQMESDLRKAIEREELVLHYQPQVEPATGQIIGVEVLVRWQHPPTGLVPPCEFIPLAEETGLIALLGEWVLRTACQQMKSWHDAGLPRIRVAVNLSSQQFRQNDLMDRVNAILTETGLAPKYLELELTEGSIMRDVEETMLTLDAIKQRGISLSVDDFGTGYSSLKYLKRFPIDTLKIDRCFINDITQNREDVAIVKAIITLAKNLKLEVVAEGVETNEQLALLNDCGRCIVQGFLYSKPLVAKEFAKLLQTGYAKINNRKPLAKVYRLSSTGPANKTQKVTNRI